MVGQGLCSIRKNFLNGVVPYIPSCNHVSPPPNNMIIHVKAKNVTLGPYPVTVKGILSFRKKLKEKRPGGLLPNGLYAIQASDVQVANSLNK